MGYCSIWDLQKELTNMANGDRLRPQNPQKDSRWLLQQLGLLPRELESQVRARAYRLTHPQYRAIWREMASDHLGVISILWSAANDQRRFNCLFNHAMKKMANFLENFATKAAPYSGSPLDPEFKILMENFGTVLDTIAIFYNCFDCEKRSENLIYERNGGRMHLFRFERNDPGPLLDMPTIERLYRERYHGTFPTGNGEPHKFYPPDKTPEPAPMDANMVDFGFAGPSLESQELVIPHLQHESFFMDAYSLRDQSRYGLLNYGRWQSGG